MRMLVGIACLSVCALVGCLRTTGYKCTSNEQCGTNGVCESVGYCSFPDSGCPSGRKFGDLAGDSAGRCVGTTGIDAAVDTPIDMMVVSCPAGYTASRAPSYRLVTMPDDWLAAEQDCENDGTGTHLAIFSDMAEYGVIDALTNANIWVGASDRTTEATWLWVTGAAAVDLGMGNNSDCARYAGGGEGGLTDQSCDQALAYVCECDGVVAMPAAYTP